MPEIPDCLPELLASDERAVLRQLHEAYEYRLVSAMYFRNRAPWRLAGRTCPDHFFLFPCRGVLSVTLEGEAFTLRPGEFLMLNEGVWHELEIGAGSSQLHQMSLHADIRDRWGRPLLERARARRGRLMHGRNDVEALRRLTHLAGYAPVAAQEMAAAFLKTTLAFQLQCGMRLEEAEVKAGCDPRVQQALQEMERRYAFAGLSIAALAEGARLTPTQFRKLFRRDVGMSPKGYLTKLRLRQAQHLLSRSTLSIKEIAGACGFNSDHYFHLTFRCANGCTPSYYRQHLTL